MSPANASSTGRNRLLIAAGVLALLMLLAVTWLALAPDSAPGTEAPEADAPAEPAKAGRRTRERDGQRPRKSPAEPLAPSAGREAKPDTQPTSELPRETETRRGAVIHVTVTDEAGNPVAGATVVAVDAFAHLQPGRALRVYDSATTENVGTARIGLPADRRVTVVLVAGEGDRAGVSERVDGAAGSRTEVTIKLEPAVRLRGQVVDPDGLAVAGADVAARLVTVDAFGLGLLTKGDENGRFELPAFPAAALRGMQTVTASARGFATGQDAIDPALEDRELRIQLARGFTLAGRCVDAGGRPVRDVFVSVDAGGSGGNTGPEAQTAKGGRFQILGVPLAGGRVVLRPTTHAPRALDSVTSTGADVDLGDITLADGEPITGVVVDAEGTPVKGAGVGAFSHELGIGVRTATTDAKGRFELPALGGGEHRLVAEVGSKDGTTPLRATVERVLAGARDVRIVVSGGLYLTVRFLAAADRSEVAVREVELRAAPVDVPEGTPPLGWAWSGIPMKSLRVGFEAAGTFDVTLSIPGYQDATLEQVAIDPSREVIVDALFKRLPD